MKFESKHSGGKIMVQALGTIKLRSGETVEAGVVRGPDLAWSQRVQKLLWHKGDPWNWQNAQVLESDLGLDVNFYLLHRDGDPFANIMTIELAGVGHFGHVWTQPADRQQGASSSLMRLQMQDFVARDGKALFLGTGYGSSAYRIYASHGFASIEPENGYMSYYSQSQSDFEASYFAAGELEIQPLTWRHWPASAALFLGNFAGLVRCAPLQLIGRASTEEAFLPALIDAARRQNESQPPAVLALVNPATTAVVGLAGWSWHPLWPDTCLVDCYCHPQHWEQAGRLLAALQLPSESSGVIRTLVYIDNGNDAKAELFAQAGFKPIATLPQWLAADYVQSAWIDVAVWQKG
jgi:hypothetical protein